jgi:hypothetical protein
MKAPGRAFVLGMRVNGFVLSVGDRIHPRSPSETASAYGVAFALDGDGREAIDWGVTRSGVAGEIIRDMMADCVQKRFGGMRAPIGHL